MKGQYICWTEGSDERRTCAATSPEHAARQYAAWWYSMTDSKASFDVHVEHSNVFRQFKWVFSIRVAISFDPFELSRVVTDRAGNPIHRRSEPRPRARAA
jgi:hypothetical protein